MNKFIQMHQKMLFFLLFLPICPWAKKIDSYDAVAIEQAIWALHLHNQNDKQEKIDLSQPTLFLKKSWQVLLPVNVIYHAKPESCTAGWEIHPFYGTTGITVLESSYLLEQSMMGFVAVNKEKKIITMAFRGSQLLVDWINNLQLWGIKSSDISYAGYIHSGYATIFKGLLPSLNHTLTQSLSKVKKPESYTFLVVGHSLGGALATLVAPYLTEHALYKKYIGKKNLRLITFASPTVGLSDDKHNFNRWVAVKVPCAKHFFRIIDLTSSSGRLIKFIWSKDKCLPTFSRDISFAPVGDQIELPSYGESWMNTWKAHNPDTYRKAIYEACGKGKLYVPWIELVIDLKDN
jgi:hypothetical protein